MNKMPPELGKKVFAIVGTHNTIEQVWKAGTDYFVVLTGYSDGEKPNENYKVRLFLNCVWLNETDGYKVLVDNIHYL